MGLIFAIASAVMYGSADFAGGFASRRSSAVSVVVVSQVFGIAVALVAAPLLGADRVLPYDLAWGAAAGVAGAIGLVALYRGIASGIVSVVSPTAAVLGAVAPLLFGILIGERPALLAWLGVALCVPATALLSLAKGGSHDRGLLPRSLLLGITSGVGFGLFFICISRPSASAGIWPLVAARATSIAAIVAVASFTGRSPFQVKAGLGVVALAGVLDMSANVAFILSTRFALLALATVVTSLYPAPTVMLGRLVFRERLGVARAAGLVCALAGVALITLGTG